MNPIEAYNSYWELSTKIWKFNDIQSQLKEWWEILSAVKLKYGKEHELFKKFEKEYRDLYQSIKEAFESEKTISQEERSKIMLELSDVVSLAQSHWIIEKKWNISKIGDFLRKTNTKQEKEKALSFRDKNIKEYSLEDSIAALSYLNQNYKTWSWSQKSTLWNSVAINYHTINELDDFWEVNMFQELLLEKILWKQKSFNDKYIAWFDESQWNYIVEISAFEKKLEWSRMDTINSRALANYFSYVSSKKELTQEVILEKLSPEQFRHLLDLWKNNPDSIAQKLLSTQEWSFSWNEKINEFFKYYDTLDEKNVLSSVQKDPSKIYLVSDKKTLLECINNLPTVSYKNINSYMQLDIDIIIAVSKKDPNFDIKFIPQSFFEIDINNKDDREKIKKLFLIGKKEQDFLKIISELSIYLENAKISELIEYFKNDENMKWHKEFFSWLLKYKNQMDLLTQNDFDIACKNVLQKRNSEDILRINLYVYKNWIKWNEEKILSLFQHYKLDDFPWVHKYLYTNQDFAIKLISKHPEEFQNLSSTLQKNDWLVNTFLDASLKENFDYNNLIKIIEQIELGKNIWIVLLIYDKLVKKYGEEKVDNLFLHPKMSQKMQVFFRNLDWTTQSEWQKEALKRLSWVFDKLIKEFEVARNSISSFQEKYNKSEEKEKDSIFLEKIEKITWFSLQDNKLIFEILKKPVNDENSRELLGLLKKITKWNNKKVVEILSGLQKLQIENIKNDLENNSQMIRENWFSTQKIDDLITKNPKEKEESTQDYKKRILNLFQKENGKLTPEQAKLFENYLQWKLSIATLEYQNKNIDLYISYLENPEKFKSFEEYKETKSPDEKSDLQKETIQNQISYSDGTNLDYEQKWSSFELNTSFWKIEINNEEFKTVSQSKEALNNLINFKETIDELWLSKLWDYREKIFLWLGNLINTKDDYIWERELKMFLIAIMQSIWIQVKNPSQLTLLKEEIKENNNIWVITSMRDVNTYGNSKIESIFISKFDPNRNWFFEQNKFNESLKWLIWINV